MPEPKKKAAKKATKKTAKKKTAAKKEVAESDSQEKLCVPPIKEIRNEYGLLTTVDYVFDEKGFVDWRNMIDEKYIVVNAGWFEKHQSEDPIPTSTQGLKDEQLIIKLGAFKDLANIRGFKEINYNVRSSTMSACVVECQITWNGNYETNYKDIVVTEVANATVDNTGEFAVYLETIAANRAFARCVRSSLRINIVSSDELSLKGSGESTVTAPENAQPEQAKTSPKVTGTITPVKALQSLLEESVGDSSFETFKNVLRHWYKEGVYKSSEPSGWNSFKDIPEQAILEILPKLKDPNISKQ